MTKIAYGIPLLFGVTFLLAGCSAEEMLTNESSRHFDSKADVVDHWEQPAEWLPADSTDNRVQESKAHDTAILALDSSTDLDASLCAEVERRSGPAFEQSWSPTDVYVDRVFSCGTWAVIKTDSGWFGWTPNDPDEREPGQ